MQEEKNFIFFTSSCYRDRYRRMMFYLLVLMLLSLFLLAVYGIQILRSPSIRYFATSTVGRVTPLVGLSRQLHASAE